VTATDGRGTKGPGGARAKGAPEPRRKRRPKHTGRNGEETLGPESLYSLLAENISDVIFIADTSLKLQYISPSVSRLLLMTPEEAVTRGIAEALTEQSRRHALAALETLDRKTKASGDRLVSHTEELEMTRKDGSTVWVEARVNLMRDATGAPRHLLGVLRDVSERKRAEQALRESEEKYRDLVENLTAVIYTTDLEGNITYVSPVFENLYGHEAAAFQGRSFVDFIHPDDLEQVTNSYNRVLDGEESPMEFRLVLEWSSEVRWVRSHNKPIREENRLVGIQGFLTDITDQKLAAEALRRSEEKFRQIYEKAPLGIISYDAEGRITGMNKAALDIFGLADASQAGAPLLTDDPSLPAEARKRLRMGKPLTYQGPFDFTAARKKSHYQTTRSGTAYLNVILTSLGSTPEGSPAGYFLLVEDITKRKATEDDLKRSEERYRLVAENVWDVIFTTDLALNVTFITPSVERSLGYTVEEMLTKTAADILTASSLEVGLKFYDEEMARVKKDPSATSRSTRLEFEVMRKDGSTLWVDMRLSFLTGQDGQPTAILGVARDITQRRLAEEALRQSEERYRHFVENVDAAFYAVDRQGCLTYLSPVFELIYGQPPSDLVGKNFADFIHPDDLPDSLDRFKKAMSGRLDEPWECRMVLPGSNKVFWVQGHNRIIRQDDAVIGMQGVLVNITERKRSEEAIRYRLAFEELITSVSTQFINLSIDEIDRGIQSALEAIGVFASVDRSYIFRLCPNKTKITNTHEWCAEGMKPLMARHAEVSVDAMPWLMQRLRRLDCVTSNSVDDLPPEAQRERSIFLREGIQAMIAVPMVYGGSFVGFLGLGCTKRSKTWDDEMVVLLRIVGEIFASALERKRMETSLRESEEKNRNLVESSPDGIISVDPAGFVMDCNDAACKVLGCGRSSLIGTHVRGLLTASALETTTTYRERLIDIGIFEDEFEFVGEDGQTRVIWAKAVKPEVGTLDLRSLVYLRDVSERRRVAELKDEFIGLVSHELRSPLTVIIGAVNTALSEIDRLPRGEMRQLLNDASNEAEALSHLLGNLLELSRAQADRLILHLEPVRLQKVARDAIDKVKQQSSTHQLVLDLPKRMPMVMADQVRLERILFNLLENGVKYSPDGGEIRLFAKKQKSEVVVGVRDYGVGISPEDMGKLFQPFQRLGDPTRNHTKGAGLGLLVCRRLVEAHEGRIWVESEVGQGTTFYFTLPVRTEAAKRL